MAPVEPLRDCQAIVVVHTAFPSLLILLLSRVFPPCVTKSSVAIFETLNILFNLEGSCSSYLALFGRKIVF